MTRVPRVIASAGSAETAKVPLPSDDHSHDASLPARRDSTSTRSATMNAE